ncbi:MAG: nitroreductase family deazaflavin-dependent oxidoreductase [Thaumarchaeota archaeon]|nr:nitroreductase family deazaflavin-dependent oxidoreductase [Nitrososphaerota archaeon]
MAGKSFKFLSSIHRVLYRLTGARLGSRFLGVPILLLTVTGRKTGRQRTTPLMYFNDGENLLIVASKGGHPSHPEWYLNLVANPDVIAQVGREKIQMRSSTATDYERSRLWPQVVKAYSGYGEYQSKTARKIPVVILKRK